MKKFPDKPKKPLAVLKNGYSYPPVAIAAWAKKTGRLMVDHIVKHEEPEMLQLYREDEETFLNIMGDMGRRITDVTTMGKDYKASKEWTLKQYSDVRAFAKGMKDIIDMEMPKDRSHWAIWLFGREVKRGYKLLCASLESGKEFPKPGSVKELSGEQGVMFA